MQPICSLCIPTDFDDILMPKRVEPLLLQCSYDIAKEFSQGDLLESQQNGHDLQ